MYVHACIWWTVGTHVSLNPHGRARGKLPPTQTHTSARLSVRTHNVHIHVRMYVCVHNYVCTCARPAHKVILWLLKNQFF